MYHMYNVYINMYIYISTYIYIYIYEYLIVFEKGLKDCYFTAIPDKPNRINHPKLTKISMASVNHLQMAGLLVG